MCPTLRPGATVRGELLQGSPAAPGEVVAIQGASGPPAVHRVIARQRRSGEWLYVTKGDAIPHTDAVTSGPRILARVTAVEDGGRLVPVTSQQARLWTRLEARAKLLLHGRVGERHPLRRVARGLAKLGRRRP